MTTKSKFLTMHFIFFIFSNSFSQPMPGWAICFGGHEDDFAKDIVVNKNGSSFICGTFQDYIKFDHSLPSIPQVNGNIVFCCPSNSYIVKYNNIGGFEWGKQITGSTGNNFNDYYGAQFLTIDEESNLYIMGGFGDTIYFDGNPISGMDADDKYIIKLDSSGNYKWSKVISSNGDGIQMSLSYNQEKLTFYSNFWADSIKVADTVLYNTTQRVGNYIATLNTDGTLVSSLLLPVSDTGSATGSLELQTINTDKNGNLYLLGTFKGKLNVNNYVMTNVSAYSQMFLIKLDSTYNLIFEKRFDNDGYIYGEFHSIAVDSNENVFIVGDFSGDSLFIDAQYIVNSGNQNSFCVKIDSQGMLGWVKGIYSAGNTNVSSLFVNNNYINIIGMNLDSTYFNGILITSNSSKYLLSLDHSGNYVSSIGDQQWGLSNNFSNGFIDENNDIYIISNSSAGFAHAIDFFGHQLTGYGEIDACLAKIINPITSISNTFIENYQVNIFPNPTTTSVFFETPNNSEIKLFDCYGRLLKRFYSNSDIESIDLSNYVSGIYYLKIGNAKENFSSKIVKQ